MHDFYFIIDEIITTGRTGTILYTLQMPKAFIDRVMYVALEVLKELNVEREDAWGKGILIYYNSIISKPTLGMKG
eukprot:9810470-Ditylum_brightwellii.AAC.1